MLRAQRKSTDMALSIQYRTTEKEYRTTEKEYRRCSINSVQNHRAEARCEVDKGGKKQNEKIQATCRISEGEVMQRMLASERASGAGH